MTSTPTPATVGVPKELLLEDFKQQCTNLQGQYTRMHNRLQLLVGLNTALLPTLGAVALASSKGMSVSHGSSCSRMTSWRWAPLSVTRFPAVLSLAPRRADRVLIVALPGNSCPELEAVPSAPPSGATRAGCETSRSRPNGALLATASDDGTARLWDLAAGHARVTLVAPDTAVMKAAPARHLITEAARPGHGDGRGRRSIWNPACSSIAGIRRTASRSLSLARSLS
jgi:hypothetical protein